jgi:hypothetical protein
MHPPALVPAAACLLAAAPFLSAQSPLRVLASSPANNAISASTATTWVVTFDRAVDPASLAGNVRLFGRWSGVLPGTATLDAAGTQLTFQPSRPLFPGEWVTAQVLRSVTALDGTTLQGGFVAYFWTQPARGTGTFRLDRTLIVGAPGGSVTYGAHAGDIDGDGSPDITTTNEASHDLRIFRNDGCGNAGPRIIYAGSGEPSPNDSADFDHDGRLDLVTGNAGGNSVAVFLNDGNGGFLAPIVLNTGGYTHGATVIDADADGFTDVAASNASTVLLFRNLGNATFAAPTTFQAGNGEDALVPADANGDGKADLFVACRNGGTVALLLGNGNGGFTVSANGSCGGNPFQIAVGDLNGDGHCDAATANLGTDTLGVVFGNGSGGLAAPQTWSSTLQPVAIDLADLDGDGDLDAGTSGYSSANHRIHWNDGTGGFGSATTLAAQQNGSCTTLVDFDRDGLMDVLSADEGSDEIRIYLQNRPALPSVQPIACQATLRVDGWAIAGYGGRPLRPAQTGRPTFFNVSAAPNAPFAVLLSFASLAPGVSLPFGLANVDPALSLTVAIGFFGDPTAITNTAGEQTVALTVPAGLAATTYAQAIALDPRPASAGYLISNPVGIAFLP